MFAWVEKRRKKKLIKAAENDFCLTAELVLGVKLTPYEKMTIRARQKAGLEKSRAEWREMEQSAGLLPTEYKDG